MCFFSFLVERSSKLTWTVRVKTGVGVARLTRAHGTGKIEAHYVHTGNNKHSTGCPRSHSTAECSNLNGLCRWLSRRNSAVFFFCRRPKNLGVSRANVI